MTILEKLRRLACACRIRVCKRLEWYVCTVSLCVPQESASDSSNDAAYCCDISPHFTILNLRGLMSLFYAY